MVKKAAENQYGVKVGDVFTWDHCTEDYDSYSFYQVVTLRGKTQVAVRKIKKKRIAFDGIYEAVVPVLNAWVSDEIIVRKVGCFSDGDVYIKIFDFCTGYAMLDTLDKEEMYFEWSMGRCFPDIFQQYNPELAKQLDLKNDSGIYAVDRPFHSIGDDCRAMIRYPDGKEQEVILRELMHYEEEKRYRGLYNSPEAVK